MLVAILAIKSRDVRRKELVVRALEGSMRIVNGLLDKERYFMFILRRVLEEVGCR